MSIRNRTTKLIARRHDLNYFKRLSPVRAWQWYLAVGALVCAVAWFAGTTLARGASDFSAGPMSSSHAVFGERCELCHVPVIAATRFTPSFGRRNHVPDSACLSCHTAPAHHPMESTAAPTCGSCHTEHIGSTHLAAVADRTCTACHANLESRTGVLRVAAHVGSFAREHPDFRPLRTAFDDEKAAIFALRFTHATHMQPGLRNPQGGTQNLQCQSCHEPSLTTVNDTTPRQTFSMAPVTFEKSCRSCHSLEFDTHVREEAPHDRPEVVRAFVNEQLTSFAQEHPDQVAAEIRNWPAEPLLPGQMRMPAPRSAQEWIANRTYRAETILYREKCELCHKDLNRSGEAAPAFQATLRPVAFSGHGLPGMGEPASPAPLPTLNMAPIVLPRIEPDLQPRQWFTAAVFSHPAHQAVECVECHAAALTSNNSKDVMMPSIGVCRRCHDGMSSPQGPPVKAGHAESGCFLCHVYHGPQEVALKSDHNLTQILGR
jgi:predicted CXXCH cytochrome family protein